MPPSENNFDLIRLFAAGQVMLWHGLHHFDLLGGQSGLVVHLLGFVPGVPIFFFVSGFLISASLARSHSLGQFFAYRALRIFPALWVFFVLSVLSVVLSGYFATTPVPPGQAVLWTAAQLSAGQFYNPDFLRGYGVGALNGSLWTIPVELQFYVLVPLFGALLHHRRALYLGLFVILAGLNLGHALYLAPVFGETLAGKLFTVSALPWLGMFLLGQMAHRHWVWLRPLVEGRLAVWALVYLALACGTAAVERATGLWLSGNRIAFPLFVVLAGTVLAAAHTRPALSGRVLGGTDISYGLYIAHMPVFNFWLYQGFKQDHLALGLCIGLTVLLAHLSWALVERPALRLKRHPMVTR